MSGKHITLSVHLNLVRSTGVLLNKFSLVLMAIVKPDYKFITIDRGGFGKNSDGGISEASNMRKRFDAYLMHVPEPKSLKDQHEPCPHVLIGDEAVSLKQYLIRQSKIDI